jgi:LysM repeat protein
MTSAPSMTGMRKLLPIGLLVLGVMLGVVAVACGGGAAPEEGDGVRVTDPARVPSSTPIQNPVLYRIQGNQVTLVGEDTSADLTPEPGNTPNGRTTYLVQSGDTCSAIAADHGISLDALLEANPNVVCENLHIDDAIRIPGGTGGSGDSGDGGTAATPVPTAADSGRTHTVGPGETCSDIAASFGVSTADIITLNGLDADCSLQVDQVVKIP